MKFWKGIVVVAALAGVGLFLSGCPLLMIGSLGYSGYQYHEKEGVFAPGQPLGDPAPDGKDKKAAPAATAPSATAPPPPASMNNIE